MKWCTVFVLLLLADCFAGTLDDIKGKAGKESPIHSERGDAAAPVITPSQLIVCLEKYHNNTIRMKAYFCGINTRGLADRYLKYSSWNKWNTKKYIGFTVADPEEKVKRYDMYFYAEKNSPCAKELFGIKRGDKITITGLVKEIDGSLPKTVVKKIDRGWIENEK